jgi:anti-sigma regulatory factor (Ser/Thr protein kinase)
MDAWADVMSIRISCPPEIWQRLQREQLTARLLVDTLSEAVTNAVRHGEVGVIDVTNEDTDNRVRLTVASLGTFIIGIGNGTGLARPVDRGGLVTLKQLDELVCMRALL